MTKTTTKLAVTGKNKNQLVKIPWQLGVVQQCTLTGSIKKIAYDGKTYCMVYHGRKSQDEAITFCKKLNAGLPLPKNKGEEDEFLKITGSHLAFWIGLTDSTQSGNKAAWKDLEGKIFQK